jgi:glycosyltransferase involved in cell wall biosynthesis
MRLSVIIPVYNERKTIGHVLVMVGHALPTVSKQIIVVDDCSLDGTREWLRINFPDGPRTGSRLGLDGSDNLTFSAGEGEAEMTVQAIYHDSNKGKGGSLQTGLAAVDGDIIVIQDADLEYDPQDWAAMYELIAVRKVADVVYGSRFYGRPHRSLYFHHYMANRLITFMFNLLYNQTLSDIEVCYKMFTRQVKESLHITCNDFGFEVQISAQVSLARKWRIYELAVQYYGRTYDEGKKINWRDGLKAIWYLFKYRVG